MSLFDTGIRPKIDEYIQTQRETKRSYGDYWSASSAGYCQRKLIFERLEVPYINEDARKHRVFESGKIFHQWVQEITKGTGLSVAQELELQDDKLMVRGHVDDIINIDGHLILYDYKTAHSRSFTYGKDRPLGHYHRYQLGTYMYMLRRTPEYKDIEEARRMSISKDDLRMDEKQLWWDKELEAEILLYWATLNKWWADKKIPPCTCADQDGGFMARERYNPYFYDGKPCSVAYLTEMKKQGKVKGLKKDA